jgi:hypothetical protein
MQDMNCILANRSMLTANCQNKNRLPDGQTAKFQVKMQESVSAPHSSVHKWAVRHSHGRGESEKCLVHVVQYRVNLESESSTLIFIARIFRGKFRFEFFQRHRILPNFFERIHIGSI